MGNFRVVIDCVGGHGVDRKVKDGEKVDFTVEHQSPDAMAKRMVDNLVSLGVQVNSAKLIHWPGSENEVTDDLVSGIRTGQFEEAHRAAPATAPVVEEEEGEEENEGEDEGEQD